MTVHIIGGGPAGCYLAKLLAEQDCSVEVWEEHSEIGSPVQCTGIVTSELWNMIPKRKEFLVNDLKKVEVTGPTKKTTIPIDDSVINRKKFDQYLAKQAKKKGVVFHRQHRFLGLEKDKLIIKDIKNKKTKKIDFADKDILIGADGPRSAVSRILDNKPLEFWTGLQAVVKTKIQKDTYQVFFGNIAPEFFAWSVPESGTTTRIGLAGTKDLDRKFKQLLARFPNAEVIEKQGGLIPKFNPRLKVQKKNIYLLGDAAGQVKATTGGGIVPGLKAAECLVKAIVIGKSYKRLLSELNKNLKKHLLIRKMLDKFSEKEYDELIDIVSKKEIKDILAKENRDKNPARILAKIVIKQPKVLKFVRILFNRKI